MSELKYTEQQMQDRLALARGSARADAWRDLLRRFTYRQRQHIANLLAHDWTITSVEMQTRYGGGPQRTEGDVPLAEALKALDAEREKRKAERAAAATPLPTHPQQEKPNV